MMAMQGDGCTLTAFDLRVWHPFQGGCRDMGVLTAHLFDLRASGVTSLAVAHMLWHKFGRCANLKNEKSVN